MTNNTIPLSIVERKSFNREGQLYIKYFVYFGDECISSNDTLEEAEAVYDNVVKRSEEPTRTIIKSTYINL